MTKRQLKHPAFATAFLLGLLGPGVSPPLNAELPGDPGALPGDVSEPCCPGPCCPGNFAPSRGSGSYKRPKNTIKRRPPGYYHGDMEDYNNESPAEAVPDDDTETPGGDRQNAE